MSALSCGFFKLVTFVQSFSCVGLTVMFGVIELSYPRMCVSDRMGSLYHVSRCSICQSSCPFPSGVLSCRLIFSF